MVSTLQRPRDSRSWISWCRDIKWQLGALSDSDGWWSLGNETRRSCWKIMISSSQTIVTSVLSLTALNSEISWSWTATITVMPHKPNYLCRVPAKFYEYSPNFVISLWVQASSRLASFSMAVMLTLVLFPGGPRRPLLPGGPVSPEEPGRPRRPRGPCSPGGPGGPKTETVLGFSNNVTFFNLHWSH